MRILCYTISMAETKEQSPFDIDFDSYIRAGEPSKKEKSLAWATAIGLQQVDGLTPSQYLYETARRNIEGEISIEEARTLVDSYYESRTDRADDEKQTEEADKVSARIVQLLRDKTFNFSPAGYIHIHGKIFEGVFKFAGKTRTYNITKKEWVLDGDTVYYSDWEMIQPTLDYDFNEERNFDYRTLTSEETSAHFARFIANIWQIHAFGEGNTRTTAIFAIKYLRKLGYEADNRIFESNSWYFRNALVRANYSNAQKGIYMNTVFLERFFRNIILGEQNELKNRYLHIRADEYLKILPANDTAKITVNDNVKITVNQRKILDEIRKNPHITQEALSDRVGIARPNINKNMKKLQEQGIIRRVGADKNGYWEIVGAESH